MTKQLRDHTDSNFNPVRVTYKKALAMANRKARQESEKYNSAMFGSVFVGSDFYRICIHTKPKKGV